MEIHGTPSQKQRLAYLDALRALAIAMVVGFHALAYVNMAESTERFVRPIVSLIGVPIFFLCDGFLFIRSRMLNPRLDYRQYLVNSARRLLVPWVALSLVYLAVRWLAEAFGAVSQHLVVGRAPIEVVIALYGSEIAPQMYFLLSLFIIRTLTIWFRHFATAPAVTLWCGFLAYGFAFREAIAPALRGALPIDLDPLRHALWGLQFYLLGALLARHHTLVSKAPRSLVCAVITASWLAIAAVTSERSGAAVQYSYLLCVYFAFLAAGSRESWLSAVGRNSMGIFLLHAPVILRIASDVTARIIQQAMLRYVVVTALTILTAHLASILIRRSVGGSVMMGDIRNSHAIQSNRG